MKKTKQSLQLKLDDHDCWSLDMTMAAVIAEMLKQFEPHACPPMRYFRGNEGEDYDKAQKLYQEDIKKVRKFFKAYSKDNFLMDESDYEEGFNLFKTIFRSLWT